MTPMEVMSWVLKFAVLIGCAAICIYAVVWLSVLSGDALDLWLKKRKIKKLRKEHSK